MNRNIIDVLKQMLVHVPADHSLYKKLEWLIKDASYKALEMGGAVHSTEDGK